MAKKFTKIKECRYTKNQILAAAIYNHRKDLLGAILQDDETYTLGEVRVLIEEFMKGKVK